MRALVWRAWRPGVLAVGGGRVVGLALGATEGLWPSRLGRADGTVFLVVAASAIPAWQAATLGRARQRRLGGPMSA